MNICHPFDGSLIKLNNILLLFLFFSSVWVFADSSLNLTLDEELLNLQSSSIFANQDWRPQEVEENAWRSQKHLKTSKTSRWSHRSIYEEDEKQLPGLTPLNDSMKGAIDNREVKSKFRFRF